MSTDAINDSTRATLLEELRTATERITRVALPQSILPLLKLELTAQQVKILIVLVTSDDGSTGQALAKSFGVSMASMSGMLDRLVSHEVAQRTPDPLDHRVRRVRATALGREVVRDLVANRPELDQAIIELLSTEELSALSTGMNAVARAMSSLGNDTPAG